MNWTIEYFNKKVFRFIEQLPEGLLARYLRYADLMQKHGPDLGMPHSRYLGDGLLELRLKSKEGIARLFYVAIEQKRLVVLHGFIKKTQKLPMKQLNTVIRRLKKVKSNGQQTIYS